MVRIVIECDSPVGEGSAVRFSKEGDATDSEVANLLAGALVSLLDGTMVDQAELDGILSSIGGYNGRR